jgi:D-threo-aldose 1-dehydrogenase
MSTPALGPLGLGTTSLGGLYEATDDAAARGTVDRAWDLGVRYFDTAPLYGSGLAERRLGAALRDRPRDEFVLSTKVGRLLRPGAPDPLFKGAPPYSPVFDFTADGIRRSLEESLERLSLDRVDLVLVHDPDDHLDEGVASLDQLRDLAVGVGVGTNSVETALFFVRHAAIDHLLIAGRYTLLDTSAAEELIPLCAKRGVAVTAAGVFNSGLLSGGTTFDYRAAPDQLVARTQALAAICAHFAVPLAAAAIQFALRHPAISTILVGARSAAEIEQDIELLAHPIPDELWQELLPDAPPPDRGDTRGGPDV